MATRRHFLLNTAKTGLALSSLPLLTQCGGMTRNDMRPDIHSDALQQLIGQEGIDILRYASLAPNGHNTQPWIVSVVEPRKWLLETDPTRWLPAVDPGNREMLLSMGAFLENLILAANYAGYAVEYQVLAQNPKDRQVAEIVLRQSTPRSVNLEQLRLRRTLRKGLLSKELTNEDLNSIMGDDAERWHYFAPGSSRSAYLNEGTLEANRIQAYRDDAQEELADWIRWSNDDAHTHMDGLTPATMEITGFAGWFVRTFYDCNDVLKKGFRETTIKLVTEQVHQHGGWLVLTSGSQKMTSTSSASTSAEVDSVPSAGPQLDVAELLETGRCFQRLCLKVRERMIAVHPMTQMLEEPQWQRDVANALGITGQAHFILRTGYVASYPEPVSLRRPVAWFTHTA
jgi:hypothetical protein